MTQIYSDDGKLLPVTLIQAGPCSVMQIKTVENDGYSAVQLGFDDRKKKHATKAEIGHATKLSLEPKRFMANLLDNAIKYTPEGGRVKVSLRLNPDRSLSLAVQDSGAGISEKDMPHIFERFYRGNPSRAYPGAGLGLSFARAVARAHGGDIAVESSSAGSAFTVNLPAAPV